MFNVESTTGRVDRRRLPGLGALYALNALLRFIWPPQCPLCLATLGSLDETCSCIHLPPGGVHQRAFHIANAHPFLTGIPLIYGTELRGPVKELVHIFKYTENRAQYRIAG